METVVWSWSLLTDCQDDLYSLEAYKNGYYDTHDLEGIERDMDEILNRIDFYREHLPVKGSDFGDYEFIDGKMVYLKPI